MATENTPSEENKAVIRQFIERINDRDLSAIDELLAPDFSPGMGRVGSAEPVVDRDGVREIYEEYLVAFPDMTADLEALVGEGNRVAAFLTYRGTHRGPFRSIEPTGNEVEFAATSLYTLRDGKIVAGKGQAGLMELVEQLGVEIPLKA